MRTVERREGQNANRDLQSVPSFSIVEAPVYTRNKFVTEASAYCITKVPHWCVKIIESSMKDFKVVAGVGFEPTTFRL